MFQPCVPSFLPLRRSLCQRCLIHTARPYQAHAADRRIKRKSLEETSSTVTASTSGEEEEGFVAGQYTTDDRTVRFRRYKPITPGLRHLIRPINEHLWKGRVYLPLTYPRKGQHIGGRNNQGRITVRHRGGGHKRRIRVVDFMRSAPGRHKVERIEYDPGRTAHIALLSQQVKNIEKGGLMTNYSYIIAAQGMRSGDMIESFRAGVPESLIRELGKNPDAGMLASRIAFRGNCLPLHMVPPGTTVYNIGLRKNGPAQLCRSAGTFGMVVGKNEATPKLAQYVDVRLKSGEVRRLHRECCGTVGIASNMNYNRRQLGKAGRSRWLGIRPTVRGVAMNKVDHPHGGGRGKSKGNRQPVSPWGQLTKGGFKTRKKSKSTSYLVTARERSVGKAKSKAKKKAAKD